ncbi:proton-conducting transporter membrane subunit [Kouleothrix sp.]|uniref:proton-conducting transporter transmembrane domain-containing protein n=1 Tax=Kouleothrix sp. TaxID=2779161 RepID=UPI0039193B84
MLVLLFSLPCLVALACLALNQSVPTRRLGVGAAATLLAYGLALLAARARGGLPLTLAEFTWMAIDSRSLQVVLRFDALSWGLALLALLGGGLALLVLALGLPPALRGFGGLFGAALLALFASAVGLANQGLALLPFAWALVALLSFLALRASGALAGSDAPVVVLLAGLCSALVLQGAALLGPLEPGTPVALAALLCWTLLGLLAFGAPPFHAPQQELAEAPAALAGALLPLGLPLLGGAALIRFMAGQSATLPGGWRLALTLLGLLALFASAAGALGTTRLRRWLAWQFSAQLGVLLICAGQGGAALSVAAPALLLNAVLSTLACFLAVALLVRHTGTDDMAESALAAPLIWPGALLLVGAASAVGLPGVWGFWPRLWLLEALQGSAPWAVAPLLAGGTLLALAFVPPLAVFWRRDALVGQQLAPPAGDARLALLVAGVAGLPLILLGAAPAAAWRGWLEDVPAALGAAGASPSLPGLLAQLACGLAALLLLSLPLALRARGAAAPDEPAAEPSSGVVAPAGLGASLRALAALAAPNEAFASAWRALVLASDALRRGLALFEQRYYLAGLLIAVIVVVLLFIQ